MALSDREKMKQKRLVEYMMSLVDKLTDNATMIAVHVLDEVLAQASGDNLEEIVDALESIVPMPINEYRWTISILYKLIIRAGGELAHDVLQAFEEEVCAQYDVKSVDEVNALDRREVVRRLCNIYRGLVRFRTLLKADKKSSEGTLARDLPKQE